MSCRVRVLNVTNVLPSQDQGAVYSSPPPPDDGLIKLSFMDALFIDRAPMQRLFFDEGPDVPPFPSLVRYLQTSLAVVLAVFIPLASKLTYRPSTGDVVVDCSRGAVSSGVKYVEAEYSGSIDDMRRLAVGDEHDTEALMQLGPVLAVQVTRPVVGDGHSAVVGVAIHHALAEGLSVWRFIRAWSAVSREGWQAASGLESPTFDRTVIRYSRAEEAARKILHAIAPALPVARSPSLCTPPDQRRRSFILRADEIQSVKQEILTQNEAMGEKLDTHPSTFVAVLSLVWTSIVRAKNLDPAADAYYLVPVDLRRRLDPPVDERYSGNRRAVLRQGRRERRRRAAVLAMTEGDPLRAVDAWLETFAAIYYIYN
ncbi:hypothetical protein EJB05_46327, partial [Eragrostis curvula]